MYINFYLQFVKLIKPEDKHGQSLSREPLQIIAVLQTLICIAQYSTTSLMQADNLTDC